MIYLLILLCIIIVLAIGCYTYIRGMRKEREFYEKSISNCPYMSKMRAPGSFHLFDKDIK